MTKIEWWRNSSVASNTCNALAIGAEEVVVQVSFAGNFASSLVIAGAVSSWVLMPGATNTHTCNHHSKRNTAYSRHHPQPLNWHSAEYSGPVLFYTSGSVLSRATGYDNRVQSMPDSVVLQPTHAHAPLCTEAVQCCHTVSIRASRNSSNQTTHASNHNNHNILQTPQHTTTATTRHCGV